MGRVSWLVPLLVLLGNFLTPGCSNAGGGPKNVLLVVNDNSPASLSIGQYYKAKRGIPDRNVCHIQCATDEWVSKSECENNIVIPIRNFITNTGVHDRIDYIVLTKGIPLKASYNDATWWGPASVTSVLTCVGVPSILSFCTNPYGPTAYPVAPVQYFTHQSVFSLKSYYAVTRLDAYTVDQVYRMIDDSVSAQAQNGLFLMDGRYESDPNSANGKANDRLRQANHNLRVGGYTTYYDDATFDSMITEFVGGRQGVMGYFSWGSNESSYSLALYTSNLFAKGSIADGFVSSSGRSFAYPPSYGQSLISDLIPQGMSGGTGYASEPDVRYATYPNVLFSRYVQGYNMAESFLAATPRLYWKAVTIGDPLMSPYATPPSVSITAPDPARQAHGVVAISADGTDASDIKKVEFYIDDQLVQSCDASPYRMDWNTCVYTEGMHTVEAIAYENSDVRTQGMASVQIDVRNIPLEVATISGLASAPLGRLVRLTSKIVIAGTDAFVDGVYVVEPDRSAGIRVLDMTSVETGARVSVEGEIDVVDGQRVLRAATVVPEPEPLLLTADVTYAGDGTPAALTPLAMPNKFIANGGSNAGPEYSGLRAGLPNCALLVKTWGRVVRTGDMAFYISDGSMVLKFAPIQDIKVSLKNLASPVNTPPVGSFVEVTGVSCYEFEDNLRWPTVRPRSESDIAIIPL